MLKVYYSFVMEIQRGSSKRLSATMALRGHWMEIALGSWRLLTGYLLIPSMPLHHRYTSFQHPLRMRALKNLHPMPVKLWQLVLVLLCTDDSGCGGSDCGCGGSDGSDNYG